MLIHRKREPEQRHGETQIKESNNECFSWKSEDVMLKTKWIDTLGRKLKLNESQFLHLNEFLENYKIIDATDNTILKIRTAFALCRVDDFIYIEIPNQHDAETEYVQYTIRLLASHEVSSSL